MVLIPLKCRANLSWDWLSTANGRLRLKSVVTWVRGRHQPTTKKQKRKEKVNIFWGEWDERCP